MGIATVIAFYCVYCAYPFGLPNLKSMFIFLFIWVFRANELLFIF